MARLRRKSAPLPARRVREAGLTGGEVTRRGRVTADDAAPATLIDELGGGDPADVRGPQAADTSMSIVGPEGIGAGDGRDEAEDAQVDPIKPAELRRIRERIARSGGSITQLEPNETRAGSPGRRRQRRR